MNNDPKVLVLMGELLTAVRKDKPNDRSELDRKYAILLTDLEKVWAYYTTFIDNPSE